MIARLWRALTLAAPVRLWAMILAGPPLTAGAGGLAWIVWRGGWPGYAAKQQLDILGAALLAVLAIIAVIIIALASVSVRASGPGGTSFEVDGDGTADVKVTAQATVTSGTT